MDDVTGYFFKIALSPVQTWCPYPGTKMDVVQTRQCPELKMFMNNRSVRKRNAQVWRAGFILVHWIRSKWRLSFSECATAQNLSKQPFKMAHAVYKQTNLASQFWQMESPLGKGLVCREIGDKFGAGASTACGRLRLSRSSVGCDCKAQQLVRKWIQRALTIFGLK